MNSKKVDRLAKNLWDYHHMNHTLEKSDCIFVLCSHDLRVADYAAKLFLNGFAPIIIFSGGNAHQGDLVETPWEKPEAEMFAEKAIQVGVPKEKIIIESKATNCGENVLFTDKILKEKSCYFNSFIAVQKPYMERRTYATLKVHWPNKKIIITSFPIDFENYPTEEISKDNLINIMVGDLQRIKIYPSKGFQIFQDIPEAVWNSYEELVNLGYTKHLIKE
ncbi:hypothetical protein COV17_03850 [Candidatus Woesearchaeota archaeon CG10_big_fil_rev_8_21_14_0_10_36_11]|nr:MAG: hypothetical protein COV17_03850 [Candidatus Woesearchaeota archaeon CG10_big_fil_rev_8_21_14_0_10_36_11]